MNNISKTIKYIMKDLPNLVISSLKAFLTKIGDVIYNLPLAHKIIFAAIIIIIATWIGILIYRNRDEWRHVSW